jgi:hypothetical protein
MSEATQLVTLGTRGPSTGCPILVCTIVTDGEESNMSRTWQVDAADFPVGGDVTDLLRFVLRYATLSPSSHNSQPWLFHLDGHSVELHADHTRRLPVVDPDDRELVMSCGAALVTLCIALRHFGAEVDVTTMPDERDSAFLARVEVVGWAPVPDVKDDDLFAAITARHTVRTAYEPIPIPADVVARMEQAASVERGQLVVVAAAQRETITHFVSEADRVQMSDPRFRRELAHWMRINQPAADDGMPGYAIGMSELESAVGPLVVRTFDVGGRQAAKDEDLARGSALLAVLTTAHDDIADWIAAGQAMQRVLLTATAADVRASFLNQPIEVPSLRKRLQQAVGLAGQPQLLLRFGYGASGAPTPRRSVSDVVTAT